ncbi:hypothetical protein FRB94_012459 [Tulasnella sp. JGI-2019a]|nr:hypothetical protein FRB94_012459 [Tulasnella sp. JGI-2019a]
MEVAKLKDGLTLLSTILKAAPIPQPFKSGVTAIPDVALQILTIVEAVTSNAEDAKALAIYIANVTEATMRPFKTDSLDSNTAMKTRIDSFKEVLEKIRDEIGALAARRLRSRIFHYASDASKLSTFKQKVDEAINGIQLETILATGHELDNMAQQQERIYQEQYWMSQELLVVIRKQQCFLVIDRLIDRLGARDNGASKKPPCLDGTRSTVLARITGWIEVRDKRVFCLSGQAGTGKSSIAASVARREKAFRRLGAVFHFTRDDQARNEAAILVIARQLSSWQSGRLRSAIASAIEEDLDVTQMELDDQFQKLILEPLESLDDECPTLVVILDAIDECDPTYAEALLSLIGDGLGVGKLPSTVKFLITSRGEPWLQYYYSREPIKSHLEMYSLGDEERTSVEEDIEVYLKKQLPKKVGHMVEDDPDWPGGEKRKALVRKSEGLFIFASTAVRIISDPNVGRDPDAELERILSSDHYPHLDGIYGHIIERACPITISPKISKLFKDVVGALVVAKEPINIHTLASLLHPDGSQLQEFISLVRLKVLKYLQAVLVIPGVDMATQAEDAQPIQFIHTSFIDYLTDTVRCESRHLIHRPEKHELLAIACSRKMDDLTYNICGLHSTVLNSEIKDLSQQIRERISPTLQYACVHFAMHVHEATMGSSDVRNLVTIFAKKRLMYWLESLSLLGRAHEAVSMIALIEAWHKTSTTIEPAIARLKVPFPLLESDDLTPTLLYDLRRFVMEFMDPIVASALHIYLSALALMPSETELYCHYGSSTQCGVRVVRPRAEQWSQILWTASKHSKCVNCISVSPDSTTIVSGSDDQTLRLWDSKTGAAIGKVMTGHTNWVNCVAISPNGMTIVSGSFDTTLHRWDAKTGAVIGKAMEGHTAYVSCVAVSPDSTAIVSGSGDHTLCLWNSKTGVAIKKAMEGHAGCVRCVTVSPDGTTIVSGSDDHTLRLWNAKTGAAMGKALKGHTNWVNCVAVSQDSTTIVSGSNDYTLNMWNAKTGAIEKSLIGHTGWVKCVALSPDNMAIVSGSHDKTLHLWDAKTGAAIGQALEAHKAYISCITISPDSITIVSGSGDSTLHLWDVKTGTAIGEAMKGHTNWVNCVVVSPDSTTIISGSYDNTLRCWDAKTGAVIGNTTDSDTYDIRCIAVSPDSETIVSGSYDNTLCLWDAKTGAVINKMMEGHTAYIYCVAVSPNSTIIVSGSYDKTLHLWDAKTGAAIGKAMEGHTSHVHCVTISPDSKTIVSGSGDYSLCRWNACTGAAIGGAIEGHRGWINCIVISPDGTTIVSGSEDETLCLWVAQTGKTVGKAMIGHSGWINCIAVSPNNMSVVSGSYDTTLCLWDAKTGAIIGDAMKGHTSDVTTVAFSDDNKLIVSMSKDSAETIVWNHFSQTQLPEMEVQQAICSGNMSNVAFM